MGGGGIGFGDYLDETSACGVVGVEIVGGGHLDHAHHRCGGTRHGRGVGGGGYATKGTETERTSSGSEGEPR